MTANPASDGPSTGTGALSGKALSIIVTDAGFLVPSLLLAEQLRDPRWAALTDVMIVLFDPPVGLARTLRADFPSPGLRFETITTAELDLPPAAAAWFKGYLPPAALARLAIADRIPAEYRNIVYLDGDMRIVGDIGPLLRLEVPEGTIAAAVDQLAVRGDLGGDGPSWLDSYLGSLGLAGAGSYFNSGLLLFRRSTWSELGPEALRRFAADPDTFLYNDQSALNSVCAGRWLRLSPAYNFMPYYLKMGAWARLDPKILHFSGPLKPWQSPASPWHPRHVEDLRGFQARHPALLDALTVYDRAAAPGALRLAWRGAANVARGLTTSRALTRNFRRYMRETPFAVT